jgi:hypothetical protein
MGNSTGSGASKLRAQTPSRGKCFLKCLKNKTEIAMVHGSRRARIRLRA